MQFVFKRDEEGRERIYVGGVCVVQFYDAKAFKEWEFVASPIPFGFNVCHINDAIERADGAGFWAPPRAIGMTVGGGIITRGPYLQVTVDVYVSDNAVLSVTVGGDES